ncbi:hypothetical protein [Bacillus cereus group sp. BfR-BA-01399]|uniref:hypothetical protein n=1 Tax=Bacillus cereus group TaxID=86661 RepID=UPI001F5A17CB
MSNKSYEYETKVLVGEIIALAQVRIHTKKLNNGEKIFLLRKPLSLLPYDLFYITGLP